MLELQPWPQAALSTADWDLWYQFSTVLKAPLHILSIIQHWNTICVIMGLQNVVLLSLYTINTYILCIQKKQEQNWNYIVHYYVISVFQHSCFFFFLSLVSSLLSNEQQRSVKTMSVWEQKASQLRRHNQASCEVLYDPEECVHLPSGLQMRPDMKTHLDRPLVVGHSDMLLMRGHQHHRHKPGTPEEAETAADPPSTPPHSHHRHNRHRDRGRAKVKEEPNDSGGDSGKDGRQHVHHSRFKNHDYSCRQEEKSRRSSSKDRSRKHHHHSSMDESAGGEATREREHRHHHSHRQSRGGNGTVNGGGRGEHRLHRKDGRSSNKDGDREGKRRRHHTHGSRSQSRAEGEESNEREEPNTNRYKYSSTGRLHFCLLFHVLSTHWFSLLSAAGDQHKIQIQTHLTSLNPRKKGYVQFVKNLNRGHQLLMWLSQLDLKHKLTNHLVSTRQDGWSKHGSDPCLPSEPL